MNPYRELGFKAEWVPQIGELVVICGTKWAEEHGWAGKEGVVQEINNFVIVELLGGTELFCFREDVGPIDKE